MRVGLVFIVLGAGIIALAGWAIVHDEQQWQAFAASHNCKVVAHQTGSVIPITGFDSKGNVTFSTASTPDKTAYACDDGVTYWR